MFEWLKKVFTGRKKDISQAEAVPDDIRENADSASTGEAMGVAPAKEVSFTISHAHAGCVQDILLSDAHGNPFSLLCQGGLDESVRAYVMELFNERAKEILPMTDVAAFYRRALEDIGGRVGGEGGISLVSTLVREGGLYWAAAGDSRLYIARERGMVRVSRDRPYEKGVQGVGPVDISLGALTLIRGDTLLLCGPDMAEMLSIQHMLEILYGGGDNLDAAAQNLCREAGGASVLLLRYQINE